MTGELVLLTGGTGFLGHAILIDLLKSGYRVRVAARSQAKVDAVRSTPSVIALDHPEPQLMFEIIPDMTANGAYDNAVQGVDYIVHAAAPLPDWGVEKDQLEKALVTASINGSMGILESAHAKGKTVKRIVMTSSTVAIAPAAVYTTDTTGSEALRGPNDRVDIPAPPYDSPLQAYCVGKAAALKASETFITDNTPSFDLISIMPSFIFGKDEFVTGTKNIRTESTKALINGLFGNQGTAGVGNAVLNTDVARAHVRALDPQVEGNQSFVMSVDAQWEDTISIAKKHFPSAFKSGFFKEGSSQPTIPIRWDSSKVLDVLGIELASYDAMVKEVLGQYLELAKKEGIYNEA
ncbi:reductase [Fusarium proliferatum]|nr:reductase [Fusarium proliferatum]